MLYVCRVAGAVVAVARAMQWEPYEQGETPVPRAGWDQTPVADDAPEVLAYLAGPSLDERAGFVVDAEDRLRFEIAFDIENRVRALEGQPPVTRAQYRNALINRWKQLNQ